MQLTKRQTWAALALVAALFGFTLFQASWLAGDPGGAPKLVASKGLDPIRGADGCLADANMGYGSVAVGPDVASLQTAAGLGADAVQIETAFAGGSLAIVRAYKSPCAADMARPRSAPAEAVAGLTKPVRIWRLKGAADAQALLSSLPNEDNKDMVLGDAEAVKAVRVSRPKLRAFTVESARTCASRYRTTGIWGSVPAECKGQAALIGLDEIGYTLWGWPNRFLKRMQAADVPVIVAASVEGDGIKGLTDLNQYNDIANSYNGYIWVDNIEELGPSLKR